MKKILNELPVDSLIYIVTMVYVFAMFILLSVAEKHHSDFLLETTKQINLTEMKFQELKHLRELNKVKAVQFRTFNNRDNLIRYVQKQNPKVYDKLAELIVDNSIKFGKMYNVEPFMAIMIMDVESDFRTDVTNLNDTVIGIMQINSRVWLSKHKTSLNNQNIITNKNQLYDPEKNIQSGIYILGLYKGMCEKDKNLKAKGFHSVWDCTSKKFFGGHYQSYSDKVKKALGNYSFMLQGE